MTEPPITEPEATAPAIPVSTKPESRRRSLRKSAQVPTVQLARLSSISGIIFAALFVVAILLVHTTPTCQRRMRRSPPTTPAAARYSSPLACIWFRSPESCSCGMRTAPGC